MTDKQVLECLIEWDNPLFEHNEGYVGRSCPPEQFRPKKECGDMCHVCLLHATSKMKNLTLDEYYKTFLHTIEEV